MTRTQQDMFGESQTPLPKQGPRTPSQTPSRSVKRRSFFPDRSLCMNVPKREDISCFSKTQPARCEDFYDLRTRQVPIHNNITELLAQYGIYESPKINDFQTPEDEMQVEGTTKTLKANEVTKRHFVLYILALTLLMVFSGFLGALCFAHIQYYFFVTPPGFPPLQITEGGKRVDRSIETTSLSLQMDNLKEELETLQDRINKLKENFASQVVQSPQKGILEELFMLDLASSGYLGEVLATPGTNTVAIPVTVTLLGVLSFDIGLSKIHRHPQTTIQGLIQEVGDCWAFEGSQGRLVLKLYQHSQLTGVSLSHLPRSVLADVRSAPHHFQLWAHKKEGDLNNGRILGDFEYNTSGPWRQTFLFEPSITRKELIHIIEFRFLTNHGNPNYTCVYRVHVHGNTP